MKRWLSGLLITLSGTALLAAAWEPNHRHWLPLICTAMIALVYGIGLMDVEGTDDGEE